MGAVCGITHYILTHEEWAELDDELTGLDVMLRRGGTFTLSPGQCFTLTGLRGDIHELLNGSKAAKGIVLQLERGCRIGVAFRNESMAHVVARSAKAFAKAVPGTIGVTTARTLTIPLAPFFRRGLVVGNPLQAIEAPMRMANQKSDRQVLLQIYPMDSGDHPHEVFYYDEHSITLREVFDDLAGEGLLREGPSAWRQGVHPARGLKWRIKFRRKGKEGGVNF
ncbi:hypothetical protein [Roseococcus thiosulfatophilus]|mgnify:CR=1 FL=1|uniref:hypothetical protein n=1 Tax=Roseococcus thiosulfatophilus TaxID=35813 RepID=UPI001A9057DE|nr:hypothetical protein [Roseococcus thiosulfatophilus]